MPRLGAPEDNLPNHKAILVGHFLAISIHVGDDDLLSLDFTSLGATPAPEPPPGPPVAPVIAPTASASPVPQAALPVALIEAAELHAAGESLDASRRLEAALKKGEKLGDAARQVWLALFELLQELGRRPAFETLALAYARRFEESPPAWMSAEDVEACDTESTGGGAQVSLSGTLTERAGPALAHLLKLAQTNSTVRLNLAKLTAADDEGCAALLRMLTTIKQASKECLLGTPEPLAAFLAGKIKVGEREHEPMWLLLLELYQQAFRQGDFEDTAVNYAVTYEVSPPSWVAPVTSAPKPVVAKIRKPHGDGFSLSGQLVGASVGDFAALQAMAAGSNEVSLDARELARIDATSASVLLELLRRFAGEGKRVSIKGLSQLVYAFLVSRGFDSIAELATRKNN